MSIETAYREIVNSYKEERQSLLEANWNLTQQLNEVKRKNEEATKEIDECIKDLAFVKNWVVELFKENQELKNRVATLLATLPKER